MPDCKAHSVTVVNISHGMSGIHSKIWRRVIEMPLNQACSRVVTLSDHIATSYCHLVTLRAEPLSILLEKSIFLGGSKVALLAGYHLVQSPSEIKVSGHEVTMSTSFPRFLLFQRPGARLVTDETPYYFAYHWLIY